MKQVPEWHVPEAQNPYSILICINCLSEYINMFANTLKFLQSSRNICLDWKIEHYANEIIAYTKKVLKHFYEDYPLDTLRIFRKYIGPDIVFSR